MSIFAAPSFYSQEDQDIYNRGFSFIPQLAYRGAFSPRSSTTTALSPTTTTTTLPLLPIQPQGRDDDPSGLGGLFGNLDLSRSKEFVKDVFSLDVPTEMAAPGVPMTGSFKPEIVTGFYNPKLGNFQTFEGKNINHGGISIKPAFASILESLGFGGEDELEDEFGNKYGIGDIRGTFTGFRPGQIKNLPTDLINAAQNNIRRNRFLAAANQRRIEQEIALEEALRQQAAIEKERRRREIINRDGGGGQTTTGITTSRAGSEGTATGGFGGGADMGAAGSSSSRSSSSSGGGPYGGGPGGIHSGYMYGGRVPYMMGGLTDLVDIYD